MFESAETTLFEVVAAAYDAEAKLLRFWRELPASEDEKIKTLDDVVKLVDEVRPRFQNYSVLTQAMAAGELLWAIVNALNTAVMKTMKSVQKGGQR